MKKYFLVALLIFLPLTSRAQDTSHAEKNIEGGVTLGIGIPSGLSMFYFHQIVGDLYGEVGGGVGVPWNSINAGLKIFTDSTHLLGLRYSALYVWLDLSDRSETTLVIRSQFGMAQRV